MSVAGRWPDRGSPTAGWSRLTRPRRPGTPAPQDVRVVDVGPLTRDDVRAILATYVDEVTVEEALPEVVRVSAGRPGLVHDQALGVARRRAAAAVSGAVERAGQVGRELDVARTDLRRGVTRYREVQRGTAHESGTCPWKGLAAYQVEDAPWFCGRERLVAELVTRLAAGRLVALVGASGSGKSSLLHAGLLASLQAGALPGSEGWVQLVMRPGEHPMRELVRVALRGDHGQADDRAVTLLERAVFGAASSSRVVLVIDQLEEAWTACPDEAERQAFLDSVAEIVASDSRCAVVVSLRADQMGRMADHATLARALSEATVLVGAPSAAEVRRAVEHPAQRAGLVLDVGLADALVEDAGQEPGPCPCCRPPSRSCGSTGTASVSPTRRTRVRAGCGGLWRAWPNGPTAAWTRPTAPRRGCSCSAWPARARAPP